MARVTNDALTTMLANIACATQEAAKTIPTSLILADGREIGWCGNVPLTMLVLDIQGEILEFLETQSDTLNKVYENKIDQQQGKQEP